VFTNSEKAMYGHVLCEELDDGTWKGYGLHFEGVQSHLERDLDIYAHNAGEFHTVFSDAMCGRPKIKGWRIVVAETCSGETECGCGWAREDDIFAEMHPDCEWCEGDGLISVGTMGAYTLRRRGPVDVEWREDRRPRL
jgi:hypothetical protein